MSTAIFIYEQARYFLFAQNEIDIWREKKSAELTNSWNVECESFIVATKDNAERKETEE